MTARFTRRFVLAGLGAATFGGAAWAGAPEVSLRPQLRGEGFRARAAGGIEALVAGAGLSGAVVCAVADVASGLRLETLGESVGMPPASVAKALTALYALDTLGPDHRFATRLMATGPIENGILTGDLILAGGGDPTLGTDDLAALAAALKATGLREVRGDFVVWDGALPRVQSIDPEQPDHVGYSPALSGIALNFNRVRFQWQPSGKGYAVSMDALSAKYRPAVEMARMQVIDRSLPVYTYADAGGFDDWTVARGALGKGGERWLPVRKPALYAGDVFATMARAHGIVLTPARVTQDMPAGARELARYESEALQEILRDMLKYSTNLTAEMVGLSASAARGPMPSSLKVSAARMSLWAAKTFGMTGTLLVDHSGLGDASRMTAGDLVGALVQVRQGGALRPLLKPFVLRNGKGQPDRSHPIEVAAKTGTLNFVSGLGGFMTATDGTELAFAIFAADETKRARIPPDERERPPGARAWNGQAKKLQQQMIERWGTIYGS